MRLGLPLLGCGLLRAAVRGCALYSGPLDPLLFAVSDLSTFLRCADCVHVQYIYPHGLYGGRRAVFWDISEMHNSASRWYIWDA